MTLLIAFFRRPTDSPPPNAEDNVRSSFRLNSHTPVVALATLNNGYCDVTRSFCVG